MAGGYLEAEIRLSRKALIQEIPDISVLQPNLVAGARFALFLQSLGVCA
jgi:hypothetical protein